MTTLSGHRTDDPGRTCGTAERIGASLARCEVGDHEVIIEGVMLAGTNWLNAALHVTGITAYECDAIHSEFLTLGERRRIAIVLPALIEGLDEIEDMRAPYVRGAEPHGEVAARRALSLLDRIGRVTRVAMSTG